MLTKESLVDLFDTLDIPPKGRELVLRARVEAPVRPVQSQGGNVITLLASRKMGREIRTESRHIEFAAAVDKEWNPLVLEYYPQPCLLRLDLVEEATGEIRRIQHTPDFLVITAKGIFLEEWKSEAKLARLAERQPYRYRRDETGSWWAPQIARQLAELGIAYRVCSDAGLPAKRVENLLHLADYLHPTAEPCSDETVRRIQTLLEEHGALYLSELLAPPYSFSADELNQAIATCRLVADLDREPLTRPSRARIYRDETLREFLAAQTKSAPFPGHERFTIQLAPNAVFRFGSQTFTIDLVAEEEFVCTLQDGSTRTLTKEWLLNAVANQRVHPVSAPGPVSTDWARYSEQDLKTANRRQALLGAANPTVSARTLRRWQARQAAATANGGHAVLALVPRTASRGNRNARLSDEQTACITNIIQTTWNSPEARSDKACYRELQTLCAEEGITPPSYPTLIERIKAVEDAKTLRSRFGKRMAYQQSEFVDVLYADTPAHGSRPWQYVHIDHTQLDVELISSRSGKPLGRPWMSFAVDAFSRRIVALYLTFDAPSYHSVMMVVRDMVRRHGRLPEFVVVDNGRDFMSSAFETFLQAMGVHLRFRPAGQPRHGAVLERMFGRVNTEYIHNLSGNTKATKNVRMTTGKHLPVNFAEWTLEAMYYGITYWASEYYDQERHPALDMSPREAYERGLAHTGARAQRQILFNEDFLIATCPPVDRGGVRKIHNQRGTKVNELLYWNPQFRDPRYAGQKLPARYDPWDASSIYVRLNDQWVRAHCRALADLGQLTEAERRALTEEFTHRSTTSLSDPAAHQRLREFMQVFTPQGAMAIAFERQHENKLLYNRLHLSSIQPAQSTCKKSITNSSSPQKLVATARGPDTTSSGPYSTPADMGASDELPEFDTF